MIVIASIAFIMVGGIGYLIGFVHGGKMIHRDYEDKMKS